MFLRWAGSASTADETLHSRRAATLIPASALLKQQRMWRWVCALTLLCAALIDTNAFKRAEMSASPFLLTSRYGRSPPRMLTPRNDRFFMSGRYGKRSDPLVDGVSFPATNSQSEMEENGEVKRRPHCDCDSYFKALKNFYKRNPEILDTPTEDE